MDNKRTTKAYEFLRMLAAQAVQDGCARLPPIRELAGAAGVSIATMSKALKLLRGEYCVNAVRGVGIFVKMKGTVSVDSPSPTVGVAQAVYTPRLPWQNVYDWVLNQIKGARLAPGRELPSVKNLCLDLGVSHITLRKALRQLHADRIIEPWKRSWRVKHFSRSEGGGLHSSIAVIAGSYNTIDFSNIVSPNTDHILQELERECRYRNIRLLPVLHELSRNLFYCAGKRVSLDRAFVREHGVLGCILWVEILNNESMRIAAAGAARLNVPTVIFDISGNRNSAILKPHTIPTLFVALSSRCGADAARFLIDRGHRSIAFIADIHADILWSRNRFNGVRQAVAQWAPDGEVRLFSREIPHLQQGEEFSRLYENVAIPHLDSLARQVDEPIVHFVVRALRLHRWEITAAVSETAIIDAMNILFEQILKWRECTAWLCHSDSLAVGALTFLRARGISIPDEISVMGFDNIPDAQNKRLTSYSFNIPAAIQRLVATILRSPDYLVLKGKNQTEVPGYIIERDTTGPASQRDSVE